MKRRGANPACVIAGGSGRASGASRPVGILTLMVLFALVGCGGTTEPRGPQPPSPAQPGVRGADAGLEMHWWIVSGDGRPVGATLAPYVERPIPVPDTMRERWRLSGLRLVSVPTAELDAIARTLPLAGPVERQWLGQRPAWTDAVRGPHMPRGGLITLDAGDLLLPPGRLRMLARCWAMPMPAADKGVPAGLRLELAPQHAESITPEARIEMDTGLRPRPRIEDEGMVFTRLVLEMIAVEGEALLIVPESRDAEWGTVPSGDLSLPPPQSGPPLVRPPTLGEAMLSLPAVDAARGARAIVVLVPKTPERFQLIRGGR